VSVPSYRTSTQFINNTATFGGGAIELDSDGLASGDLNSVTFSS
jgi:predicted outer membrane repeat protein